MEAQVTMQGHSPAIPVDAVLQMIAGAGLSGLLRAKTYNGTEIRLTFSNGKLTSTTSHVIVEGGVGSRIFSRVSYDPITILTALLESDVAWAFDVIDMKPLDGVELQGMLMEVARRRDEKAKS